MCTFMYILLGFRAFVFVCLLYVMFILVFLCSFDVWRKGNSLLGPSVTSLQEIKFNSEMELKTVVELNQSRTPKIRVNL